MPLLTEIEAAIRVRMSPELLRWFTAYAPKPGTRRKLSFETRQDEYFYDEKELLEFDSFLKEPWSHAPGARLHMPAGIVREIQAESHSGCAVCNVGNDGEAAHIDAVRDSHSNHPHNLIWLCPNHHTAYDHGHRLHATLDRPLVQYLKDRLLNEQVRCWRTELRAMQGVLLLIGELERLRTATQAPDMEMIHPSLMSMSTGTISTLRQIANRVLENEDEDFPHIPEERTLAQAVSLATDSDGLESIDAVNAVVAGVLEARDAYLDETFSTKCPLCDASSYHRGRRCPICNGSGIVASARADELDLAEFEDAVCPLCEGSRYHRSGVCLVCEGDGSVDIRDLEYIDLSEFEDAACPVCRESGRHQGEMCPICGGDGHVDIRDVGDIELYDHGV